MGVSVARDCRWELGDGEAPRQAPYMWGWLLVVVCVASLRS